MMTVLQHERRAHSAHRDQFIEVVDSYIRWYNGKRIKISPGALGPLEYRESFGPTT
nr:IS3 family transposase [Burkholderia stabilis]